MDYLSKISKILKIVFVISFIIFFITFFQKRTVPKIAEFDSRLYQDPKQTETQAEKLIVQKTDGKYEITPKYDYELWGLVMSYIGNEAWYSSFLLDTMNSKDLCVIWGDNLKNNVYRALNFTNRNWICYVNFKTDVDPKIAEKYKVNQISNNHLLPANESIKAKIRQAGYGDQIYLKGYLVDYKKIKDSKEWTRNTSTTRDDSGCEVIYVTDFEVLKYGHPITRVLNKISLYSGITTLILIIFITLIEIFSPSKKPESVQQDKLKVETNEDIKKEIMQKIQKRKDSEKNLPSG